MLRKTTAASCFLILGLGLGLGAPENADPRAGYAILDGFVGMFQDLAQKGTGGFDAVDNALQKIMVDIKKAKAEGKIDRTFYARMTRLLVVVRLAIQPDPEIILGPFIEKEIAEFVQEVTGEEMPGDGKRGIGAVAMAMAHEIISLRIYLETLPRRAELMSKLEKGLLLEGR